MTESMVEIAQFVPGCASPGICKEDLREAIYSLNPAASDDLFEAGWSGFLAMRERVNNPRRRIGTSVSRIGDVLFPPVHYVRASPDEALKG